MGRIWRGLRLGMKSLLLHKLRSGLTVLGIVFGVAAVISMLAVGEGASREARPHRGAWRDQHHHSLGQAAATRPRPRRPARTTHPQLRAEVRRLRPHRRDHSDDQQGAADPRDPQADPLRRHVRSTAASSAPPKTTPNSTTLKIAKGRFLDRGRQRAIPELRRARARDRRGPSSPTKTRSARRSSLGLTTTRSSASPRSERALPQRAAASPGRTSTGRLHSAEYLPAPVRRADHRHPLGRFSAEETQLTQITIQVGSIDEVTADGRR